MFKNLPISLPDEVLTFCGTAAELAETCNALMARSDVLAQSDLLDEKGAANERLIRHYVQLDVLSPPVRQGREALYGARQVYEFLIARHLLRDGWPLAKIAELVKTYDLPDSRIPAPDGAEPTAAEQALARIRSSDPGWKRKARAAPNSRSMASVSLDRAAEITTRRLDLNEDLRALGNPSGKPTRSEWLRLQLTPWCVIEIESAALRRLAGDAPELLGQALARALQDERLKKGDRK